MRCLELGALGALFVLGIGCNPNPVYEEQAKAFLTNEPGRACCATTVPGDAMGTCEHEKRCPYFKGATLTTTKILEQGNAARTVTIELSGPSGKGRCDVFVAEGATGHGSRRAIRAERATCQGL